MASLQACYKLEGGIYGMKNNPSMPENLIIFKTVHSINMLLAHFLIFPHPPETPQIFNVYSLTLWNCQCTLSLGFPQWTTWSFYLIWRLKRNNVLHKKILHILDHQTTKIIKNPLGVWEEKLILLYTYTHIHTTLFSV